MKSVKSFWNVYAVLAAICAIIVFMLLAYYSGKDVASHECGQRVVEVQRVPTEPCEYKTSEVYYKGSCDATDKLLDFDKREAQLREADMERWESFQAHMDEYCVNYLEHNAYKLKGVR